MFRLASKVAVIILTLVFSAIGYSQQFEQLETVKASVKKFAEQHIPLAQGERMNVEVGYLDSRLKLSKCSIPLEVFMPNSNGNRPASIVGVRCNGIRPWKIYVPVKLQVYKKVLVAARTLSKGTKLAESDIKSSEYNVVKLKRGFFVNPDEVIGKVLTRSINTGTPLNDNYLRTPLMVKRGQAVTITTNNKILQVTMKGIAMKPGHQGEVIPVKNTKTKRVVDATVISTNKVEVVI